MKTSGRSALTLIGAAVNLKSGSKPYPENIATVFTNTLKLIIVKCKYLPPLTFYLVTRHTNTSQP
jgi:hypothetical protein